MQRFPDSSSRRPGLSLIEVTLGVAVGLLIMGSSVVAYQQIRTSSKFSAAKSMVGTIQTNIGMEKFRLGSAPPQTPAPGATAPTGESVAPALQNNLDSASRAYWPAGVTARALPADPVMGLSTVMPYTSTASATPLAANAPSAQWDNPIFANSTYGKGGWLYDTRTGAFRINLSNQDYPEQRPGSW